MRILFLNLLLASILLLVEAQPTSSLNINLSEVTKGNLIVDNSSSDVCGTIRVGNTWIYHLTSQNIYERWAMNDLTTSTFTLNFTYLYNTTITDYQIGDAENFVSFLSSSNISNSYVYDQTNPIPFLSTSFSQTNLPSKLYIIRNFIIIFYASNSASTQATLEEHNLNSQNLVKNVITTKIYDYIQVSPYWSYLVIWSQNTSCIFYRFNGLKQLGTFIPSVTPPNGTTSSINFSQDETLVIIETDNYNPVLILSMSTLSVVHSIPINKTIENVYFLNSSNSFLVVVCSNSFIYVDLRTYQQYTTAKLPYTTYTLRQNKFYTCWQNVINSSLIAISPTGANYPPYNYNYGAWGQNTSSYSAPSQTASNNSANASNYQPSSTFYNNSNNSNQNNANSSNSSNYSNGSFNASRNSNSNRNKGKNHNHSSPNSAGQTDFYYSIDLAVLGQTQSSMFRGIGATLQTTTQVAYNVANFAVSTPVTIYFLAFLNFISTSSLYVLLNFPLPQQIYNYFQMLYNQLNTNLFQQFGITFQVNELSIQKVDSSRAIHFGISSDVVSSNYINLLLFVLNVGSVFFLCFLFNNCLGKQNIFRYFLCHNKKTILYGQLINLMQPLILPWSFIFLRGGSEDYLTKLNFTLYFFLFLLCFFLPYVYLLQMIWTFKGEKILKKKNTKESQVFLSEIIKHIYNIETQRTRKIINVNRSEVRLKEKTTMTNMVSLINSKIMSDWYLCITNFVFPFLVLLQNPVFFLVLILFHNLFGATIALKTKNKINNTILAIYPVIFHSCFGVFYWCNNIEIIAFFITVCLLTFLLGLAHNALTILVEMIILVCKFARYYCLNGRITPKDNQVQVTNCEQRKNDILSQNLPKPTVNNIFTSLFHYSFLKKDKPKQMINFSNQVQILKEQKKEKTKTLPLPRQDYQRRDIRLKNTKKQKSDTLTWNLSAISHLSK